MAKKCYVCGKKPLSGNKVSHSNRKTRTRWYPNLQNVRILVGKTAKNSEGNSREHSSRFNQEV